MNQKFFAALALCLLAAPGLHAQPSGAAAASAAIKASSNSAPSNLPVYLGLCASIVTALVAAGSAYAVAAMNRKTQDSVQAATAQTQSSIAQLNNELRQQGVGEERTYATTTQQAEPFFTALTKSQHLLIDAIAHAQVLAQVCPLSPEYKRAILAGTGIIDKLSLTGIELSEQLASVLMVLDDDHVNKFVNHSQHLVFSQNKICLMFALSFDFEEASFKKPEAQKNSEPPDVEALFVLQEKHSLASANLFMLVHETMTRRRSGMKAKPPTTWDVAGLAKTLTYKPSASLFNFSNPIAMWSVWWTRDHEDISVFGPDEFLFRLNQLLATVQTKKGFVGMRQETAQDDQREHFALSVDFASAEYREQFLKVLPAIKAQSRVLWGPYSRETVAFMPVML